MNFNAIPEIIRNFITESIASEKLRTYEFDYTAIKHGLFTIVNNSTALIFMLRMGRKNVPFNSCAIENSHDKFIAELIKQYIHKVATGQTRKYKTITYNHIDDKTYEIHLIPIKKQLQDFIPVNTEIDRSPDTKKILKIISKTPGITQAELSNRSRFVDIATRKQILEELINAGLISCEVFQLSPKTKKTRKYTLNKNNHEIEKIEDDEIVPLPVLIPEHVQKKLEEIDAIYRDAWKIPDTMFKNTQLLLLVRKIFPILEKLMPHFPSEIYFVQVGNNFYRVAAHGKSELQYLDPLPYSKIDNLVTAGNFAGKLMEKDSEYSTVIYENQDTKILTKSEYAEAMAKIINREN